MKIIRASEKHIEELADLERKYMEYHRELDNYFVFKKNISELFKEHTKRVLRDKDQLVLLATMKNKIIGYVTARITQRPPIYEIDRIGVIGDTFVLPEFRNQGVFTQLIEQVIDWMRKKRIKYVEHPVAARNKIGLQAYKNRGFEEYLTFVRRKI